MAESDIALEEEIEQLRRFLMLVSYSGMSIDKTLDTHLRDLRTSIKKSVPLSELKNHVDAITDYLRQLEESVEVAESSDQSSSLSVFVELLNALHAQNFHRSVNKKIEQLQKKLSTIESPALIDELKTICLLAVEKSKKSGWSLFGGKNKTSSEDDEESIAELSDTPTEKDASLPRAIIDALNNFIEQINTIDIYRSVTQDIKKQIGSLESYDQLSPLIEQIASALLEAANQEHVQFENFLKTLNKRLLNVASFLNQASVGHEATLSDTETLDKALKDTINSLKQEIEDAPELGQLKSRLLTSFEYIFDSVNRFKESQNTRVKASMAELEIVKEHLKVTEDEAERLKENLMEQRSRAYTDPLTQLPNRYAYNERLNQEYTRWRRYRSPLALAVGDIDFFKKVNDENGHSAGDKVLQHVAELLSQGIRESDFIARYGGEEFIILMPETTLTDATKAINKLRQMVGKTAVKISGGKELAVSLSFGVAEFEGSDTANAVFAKADKALYRAKDKGRNQVCAERS